jgi:hypothetical protein
MRNGVLIWMSTWRLSDVYKGRDSPLRAACAAIPSPPSFPVHHHHVESHDPPLVIIVESSSTRTYYYHQQCLPRRPPPLPPRRPLPPPRHMALTSVRDAPLRTTTLSLAQRNGSIVFASVY